MKPGKATTLALLIGAFLVSAGLEAAPCTASNTVLCLSAQRFSVEVNWKDFAGNTGSGRAVLLTPDTGYFWFFSESNVELVVKVLDARGFNGHFWVFFGALSNVEYTLSVTDTATGSSKTYQNPSGQFASVGDTAAFRVAAAGGIATHETVVAEGTPTPPESLAAIQSFIDAAGSPSASEAAPKKAAAFTPCPGPSTSLYLSNCRFELSVEWTDFQGRTGAGQAVQLSSDTGYFWFFSESNVELIVKVLDARGFNDRFWVFYGALSNVEYSLHVTDRVSGALRIYRNPSGDFASVGDTSAFRRGYGVAVSLDSGRAVSGEIIAASGGTLSATAADGTVFTLEIPPNAFLSDKTVTMTPVASIQALPFSGGLVAAVDLQPSGVYLMEDARLTIRTSSPTPRTEETTFAWNGSGEDFFLYPPVAAGGDLQMSVSHFGGYGVGRGTDAERQTQLGREPAGEDDRLSHQIALFLREGRSEARSATTLTVLRATDSQWREPLANFLEKFYVEELRPQLRRASDPDDVVKVETLLRGWLSKLTTTQLQDRLLPNSRTAEIGGLVEGMLRRALNIIHTRCKADVTAINNLPRIVALTKHWFLSAKLEHLVAAAMKCLNFQLTFDSTFIDNISGRGASLEVTHAVTATVKLANTPNAGASGAFYAAGEGTISYTKLYANASPGPCVVNVTDGPSTFRAQLTIYADIEKSSGFKMFLDYAPGQPPSTMTVKCPEDEQPISFTNWWAGRFFVFHFDELGHDAGGVWYEAKGLALTGRKNPWAMRSYTQFKNLGFLINEITFINIDHTPE